MNPSNIALVKDLESTIDKQDIYKNYFIASPVPDECKTGECILGIDEAGRGPVLGPMVYGICYCPKSQENVLKMAGCADSKTLTEADREKIFDKLCKLSDSVGWEIEAISPVTISNSMLKRQKVSLNELSHNSAIGLVRRACEAGANITEIYVDTVGPADKYQAKLQGIFPRLKVTVKNKADSLFPVVSAASIFAKVTRDVCLRRWNFRELKSSTDKKFDYGSGYPNDPVTKKFLSDNMDPIFGFPDLVRFSWSTAAKILDDNGPLVEWDDAENETSKSAPSVKTFFTSSPESVSRCSFFKDRHLINTNKL